jgi:hypothetical protein
VYERLADRHRSDPRFVFNRTGGRVTGPSDGKAELERQHFWRRFTGEFGDPGDPPESYWDARLGYFSLRPGDLGELTPSQMLGTVDLFTALHGAGDDLARRLAVEIVGDSRDLERAFQRSGKSAENFNKDVNKAGKGRKVFSRTEKAVGGLVAGLGAAGLAGAARAAFTEMGDAQKVSAQTAAALKSTGAVANVTAGQMDKLATALMNKSGVDDEAIKSSENLLLTFTNIRNETGKNNDIFNQATKATLDMSTALGNDLKGSSILVGKALNDPIKGMTALRRVGVAFTDEQKDMVEGWVQQGKTLKAQKFILGELTTEFGGSAKAAGQTLPGALNKLKENALNLGGTIATLLTPQIQATIQSMEQLAQQEREPEEDHGHRQGVVETLSTAVGSSRGRGTP